MVNYNQLNNKLKLCPVCRSKDHVFFSKVLHKNYLISYDFCKNCATVFQNPTFHDKELNTFYEKNYEVLK